MKRTSLALVAVSFVAACSGKVLLVGTNDAGPPSEDGDARGGGGTSEVDGSPSDGGAGGSPSDPWYCLDLPFPTSGSDQVAITFKLFNPLDPISAGVGTDLTATSYTGVPGITVEACSPLTAGCAMPSSGPVLTDDAGEATVAVPQDYTGYIQYTGAGYLPSTLYMGNLLADASTFSPPVQVLARNVVEGLSVELGVPIEGEDAGVGLAFFEVYDCFDDHQPGVQFTVSVDAGPNAVAWYAQGTESLPSKAASNTDSNGAGGVVNIGEGAVTLTATLVATSRVIGSTTVLIQPGWATTAWIRARSQH